MKWLSRIAGAVLAVAGSGAAALDAGEPAPAFELPGSDGRTHRLADHVGKQALVLAWFPKAFTPG